MAYSSLCRQAILDKMASQLDSSTLASPATSLRGRAVVVPMISTLPKFARPSSRARSRQVLKTMAAAKSKEGIAEDTSMQARMVQWYPGHVARAERELKTQLNSVDVVIELRDARIPMSTAHPHLPAWIGTKPHLLLLNRVDMVTPEDQSAWAAHFRSQGQAVWWTDAKLGAGVRKVERAALEAGANINEARKRRGLRPRPVKAAVVGFPNVGKSALINRLLGKKVAASAARPGVTRQLRWIRLGGDVDLLDTPGVLPMSLMNQTIAQRLAVCNDIGEASYLTSLVAAAMVDSMMQLPDADILAERLEKRYKLSPIGFSGETFVAELSFLMFKGDEERAGQRLLTDYRHGHLGAFSLERPLRR